MKITSAEAAKMLRKLNDEITDVEYVERRSREFVAAVGEDLESVRPAYDYEATKAKLQILKAKVRKLKHAINVFNVNTVVPGFDMTVDQMLVYIPQLSSEKLKLGNMSGCLPKERESSGSRGGNTLIEYKYVNYDLDKVKADSELVVDELAKAQTALDVVNNSVTFEVEID